MFGAAAFPALLPGFIEIWSLSNTEAGFVAGVFFAGYMLGVPVLTSLTDRVEPRRIYLAGTLLTGFAFLGFALFADGFVSALPFQALAGFGLAGTYMPGLKALTDRVQGPTQSRYVSFYLASFAVGMGVSYFVAGAAAGWFGWRGAYGAAVLGSVLALAVVFAVVPRGEAHHIGRPDSHLLDFRPVFRSRIAMAYILGYAAHMWELFAFRGWIVAFLHWSQNTGGAGKPALSAVTIAAVVNMAQLLSSVGGNEMALRFGRRRWLLFIMSAAVLMSLFVGFNADMPFAYVALLAGLYGVLIAADSSAVTAGAVAAAPPGLRGATMAVHSTLGFGAGFLGTFAIGIVLDLAGGMGSFAWGLAFAAMGAGCALGPVALLILGRREEKPA